MTLLNRNSRALSNTSLYESIAAAYAKMSESSSEIPVDEDYNGDSDDESRRTLASTFRAYRYRYDRRFHEDQKGTHPYPNDMKSADNERIAHEMFLKMCDDRPYIAPIETPRNIIDLGTGIGLWASLLADWFDGEEGRHYAMVKGVDLAPQTESSVQPNLEFEVDDITKDWASQTLYDLVHIRLLWGVVDDWPKVYAESFRHMNSGGYIQLADIEYTPRCDDASMPEDTVWRTWEQTANSFREISHRRFFNAMETKREMKDAGFVDIVEKRYKLPIGGWSSDAKYREVGTLYARYWQTGMDGWIIAPTTEYLGWPMEKVNNMLKETRDTLADPRQHVYYHAVIIYAKKP